MEEVAVESVVEPIACGRSILSRVKAFFKTVRFGGNCLRVPLTDNLAILEKPEEQRAPDQGEDVTPSNPMCKPIGTFLQELEHLLEYLIRCCGLAQTIILS